MKSSSAASRQATGMLVIDNLEAGCNLHLVGTGTGLAPFLSVIRDPEIYARIEKVVLLHGCRRVKALAYGEMITQRLPKHKLIGEFVCDQLIYYPTATREPSANRGRITDLITSGKLFNRNRPGAARARARPRRDLRQPALGHDRRLLLTGGGSVEGNHGEPAQFVVEKAFAER
jgi:ferredoxin/flavodoxin---NADP+ reductase